MTYERPTETGLDYGFCHYGTSKLRFRGPQKDLKLPYDVFIGATETFGKFVKMPFPDLVAQMSGVQSINLGIANAGVDAFVKEPIVAQLCADAGTTVIQIMGAQNMSNCYYSVHPRRNDRFLQASDLLKTLYSDVDFTEFTFTRHMLRTLKDVSSERFEAVETALRSVWVARMEQLLTVIPGRKVLLKLSDKRMGNADGRDVWADPMFVSGVMIDGLRRLVADVLKVDVTDDIFPQDCVGMQFSSLDAAVATGLPGPRFHDHVADCLRHHMA